MSTDEAYLTAAITVQGSVSNTAMARTVYGDMYTEINSTEITNHFHSDRRVSAVRIDPDDLRRGFVEPPEWADVLAHLRPPGSVVVLLGGPGSGRRTTAVNLLLTVNENRDVQQLLPDQDEPSARIQPDVGTDYLLDLSASFDSAGPAHAVLEGYLATLRQAGRRLVVLAESDGFGWPDHCHVTRLNRPDATAIFERFVSYRLSDDHWPAWNIPELRAQLVGAAPADAVRLGQLVLQVLAELGPDSEFPVDEVLSAYRNWVEELKKWDRTTDPDDEGSARAMLLAVAALEGARPEAIFAAAGDLLRASGTSSALESGLTGPGLATRLQQVHARLDEGGVVFARTAYAQSVLDHVWTDRPQLRLTIRTWLAQLGRDDRSRVAHLARTVRELAVRQGDVDLAVCVAEAWSAVDRDAAATMLAEAAESESIGRAVRRRLYTWAQSGANTERLLLATAVCTGPLAVRYPQVALTRLRHLAARPTPAVQEAVVQGLGRLAASESMGFALEQEVVSWLTGDQPVRADTGRMAFLALTGLRDSAGHVVLLHRLLGGQRREVMAEGWQRALRDDVSRSAAGEVLRGWLEAGLDDKAVSASVRELLVDSCAKKIDQAYLGDATARWLGGGDAERHEERRILYEELVVALNDKLRSTTRPAFISEASHVG